MPKHFVVSDLHLGHANAIIYEPIRAQKLSNYIVNSLSPEEIVEIMKDKEHPMFAGLLMAHNDTIIKAWNKVVKEDDIVFFLGDFCLTRNKEFIKIWVSKLNGRKRMIMGNHDTRKPEFYIECGFESVSQYPVLYNNHIFLSHEPLPHEIVPKGYINFFGHVHSNTDFNWERGICVSIEQLEGFSPISIDDYIGDWSELYPDRHADSLER